MRTREPTVAAGEARPEASRAKDAGGEVPNTETSRVPHARARGERELQDATSTHA